ncbi:LysM peptidoglycan-binding domain-containing protein [Thermoanaerobacterium thermosaccharolyticum]|jgi:LysM domain.|uniref:LysM peptidoglycan-binding domain-containing protein n=1 Tax=Thermoanaerobacterium thermosaccharolyticum TaxID=1517 RepID=UPI0027991A4B|nr:LysM peptidoglycan-binding domain-containing protein [Thermoanaerobacterium thermosaccharolyticum]
MITLEFTYIVKSGDTLFSIAKKFNTSVESIISRNNIVNPSLIYPGQTLIIPVTGVYYTVMPGDTVYMIGQKFGVPYESIIYVNNILYPYTIYPGQMLFVPGANKLIQTESETHQMYSTPSMTSMGEMYNMPPSAPTTQYMPCPTYYVVQPGDTLWSISNRFGISLDEILRANYFADPNMIYPGQTIIIPCPSKAVPMPPSPPVYEHPKEGRMVYVVKPGDTLYTIAMRFNTTVDAILRANPDIQNPSLIYPGQRIIIPVVKESENNGNPQAQNENKSEKDSEKTDEDREKKASEDNDEKGKTIQ